MKTNKDLIIEPNAAIEGRKYSEEADIMYSGFRKMERLIH